jgi:hypothetical protein
MGQKLPTPSAEDREGMALNCLETRIEGGYLFIVPRFHVISNIAAASSLEWFSIISTPNPIFSHLVGKTSMEGHLT